MFVKIDVANLMLLKLKYSNNELGIPYGISVSSMELEDPADSAFDSELI